MGRISVIFFIIYLLSGADEICAQEFLEGLEENAVAAKFYKDYHPPRKATQADTLNLPFIDDFSDSYVIPKISLWSDKFAFINNTYPISPVTEGVATLDALDYDGTIYKNAGTLPFQADFLTSRPLNLALNSSDSIFLSFFYQPKGNGEMPETGDSLMLDFYSVQESQWRTVWSTPGDSTVKKFKRVMIPVKDSRYLKKGFRFRFRNYASLFTNNQYADLRSNTDHWNIDYVKLDKNRTIMDTVLRDVAFIDPMFSLLKDYETVPWKHFEAAHATQMRPYVSTVIMNHDSITRNIKTYLEIRDLLKGTGIKTTTT
jgi:hypothetical protein